MASPEPLQLSLHDILAFSEAELVLFLTQIGCSDGGFDFKFEDLQNLPKDQRDELAEKLRVGAQKATNEAMSCPVDAGQVAARLLEITDQGTSSNFLSRLANFERSQNLSPTSRLNAVSERVCYNDLVDDGYHPIYPSSLRNPVSENPEEYREMLRPWHRNPDVSSPAWHAFWRLRKRWQYFRKWQQDNRGINDDEAQFAAYVKANIGFYEKLGTSWGETWLGSTDVRHLESLKRGWESDQRLREWGRQNLREDCEDGGILEYHEAVRSRLAQHGFTQTFQLHQDPKRQDKLTTWIEYLNFEYWWYDQYTRSGKRLQLDYDEAWKKLVDSGMLLLGETDETLRNAESVIRLTHEVEQAEKVVGSAAAIANSILLEIDNAKSDQPNGYMISDECMLRLSASHSRLVAAQKIETNVIRRRDLITDFILRTRRHNTEKKNLYRHSILLQWIREQVPLIAAESNNSKVAEGSSPLECGVEISRGDQGEQITKDRTPTKPKRSDQVGSLSGGIDSPAQARESAGRGRPGDITKKRRTKGLRNGKKDVRTFRDLSTKKTG